MPDQRIDVIVTKPRPVGERGEWMPYTVVNVMYGRHFDKGATAELIHESLKQILDALQEKCGGEPVACDAQTNPVPLD